MGGHVLFIICIPFIARGMEHMLLKSDHWGVSQPKPLVTYNQPRTLLLFYKRDVHYFITNG